MNPKAKIQNRNWPHNRRVPALPPIMVGQKLPLCLDRSAGKRRGFSNRTNKNITSLIFRQFWRRGSDALPLGAMPADAPCRTSRACQGLVISCFWRVFVVSTAFVRFIQDFPAAVSLVVPGRILKLPPKSGRAKLPLCLDRSAGKRRGFSNQTNKTSLFAHFSAVLASRQRRPTTKA